MDEAGTGSEPNLQRKKLFQSQRFCSIESDGKTQCSDVVGYQCFRGPFCLRLQSGILSHQYMASQPRPQVESLLS